MLTLTGSLEKIEDIKPLLADVATSNEDSFLVSAMDFSNLELLRNNWPELVLISKESGFTVSDDLGMIVFERAEKNEK